MCPLDGLQVSNLKYSNSEHRFKNFINLFDTINDRMVILSGVFNWNEVCIRATGLSNFTIHRKD